ncbi:hypothetical protein KAS08_00095 [Candidatus Pacearchaeota archaeon]|nr:hypothetical protein [Candidatus Pacearchaeota archaeon]
MREDDKGFRFYVGNMFGGKTAKMIFDLQRADYAGKKVQAFKLSWDNRYKEGFITANNGQLKYPAVSVPNLSSLEKSLKPDTEILAIEEAHFWDERLKEFILEHENNMLLISTGLQFNYRGESFHLRSPEDIQIDSKYVTVADLMGISTDVRQEWPVCTYENGKICGDVAYYPQRWREDGSLSKYSDDTIVIGAKNAYAPRCREHFVRPKKE